MPGTYIEETSNGGSAIRAAATSIAAFVGYTASGPLNRPTRITNFGEFQSQFGGFHPESELSYATDQFFRNGGATAWIVRVAANDGSPPDLNDIKGSRAEKTGIYALEDVDLFNILNVTGVSDPGVLGEAIIFAEERRSMILLDMPATVNDFDAALAWINDPANAGLRHRNAAAYFPRVRVPDPLRNYRLKSCVNSGVLAGLFARTDARRGVWKAPAGAHAQLIRVEALEYNLTDAENEALNPLALNCLRTFENLGLVSWGARTMAGAEVSASEWKYVPVRRLALFIEESLYRGLKSAVFQPNDEQLWARIEASVGDFMTGLFQQGAFQGTMPREAFSVRCDATTTTPDDVNQGVVNVQVGFAPVKPADFLIIQIRLLVDQGDSPDSAD